MDQVRLPDLEVIKRFSIAVRREHASVEEVLEALRADLEAVSRAGTSRRAAEPRAEAPARSAPVKPAPKPQPRTLGSVKVGARGAKPKPARGRGR